MEILDIEFKNFASYGNRLQKISLEDDYSLYLVAGGNGSGKSTLQKAIKYLIYGKVDDVNLTSLPNRINKSLWGKIKIKCKNSIIEIERGIKPNIFNVSIDGKPYDQAGKNNVQDYLEKEFIDIPLNVFKNILVLSINDFKSFLVMSNSDKKNIVDRIFGYTIINEMKERVKIKRKDINNELYSFDRELGIINESILSINDKISQLEKISIDKNNEKIQLLKDKIIKLSNDKKSLNDNYKTIKDKYKNIEQLLESLKEKYNKEKNELGILESKYILYENNICPECESDLTSDFHIERKKLLKSKIDLIPNTIDNIKNELDKHKNDFITIRNKEHELTIKINNIENEILTIKKELINLSNFNKDDQVNELNKLINESIVKKDDKYKKRIEKLDESNFLEIVDTVLGEDGIKEMAMRAILPTLNKNIDQLLQKIHLNFSVKFDSKFNAIIKSLGEEIDPYSLSTGERKKLDFIIIIALIKIIKLRYPNINILFLDEIFSSVDSDGIYTIIKILGETIKECKINTFVINHTILPSELFDKKIEVKKENGFSSFLVEKIV